MAMRLEGVASPPCPACGVGAVKGADNTLRCERCLRVWTVPARVLGIDPSITGTGIACTAGSTLTIRPVGKGDARLIDIRNHVAAHLAQGSDLVVIEDLPTHAHGAGITGMVQGVIRIACHDANASFVTVPPASLKKYATGKGTADKHLMRMEAFKRAGVEFHDDNQCDAWWLRAMGMEHLGHPVMDLPQTHLVAMAAIAWPVAGAAA